MTADYVCTGIAHYRVCSCCPDDVYGPPWTTRWCCGYHVWLGSSKALHFAGDCPGWKGRYDQPGERCTWC